MRRHISIPALRQILTLVPVAVVVALAACGDSGDDDGADDEPPAVELDVAADDDVPEAAGEPVALDGAAAVDAPPAAPAARSATLTVDSTWQWQLDGEIDTSYDVDVYDIDLFDTPVSTIESLQADGRVVVCHFSAGSHEDWREDAGSFPFDAIGEPLGDWPGERWVDVRDDGLRDVMTARLDLAAEKGCDGVEPDNVAAYDDDTGFDFAIDDQLAYNRFLADAAHDRGLLIGLKNALEQIPELVDHYDFAVNEQCHEYDECDTSAPFLAAGKPVFNAEYADRFVADPEAVCAEARAAGLRTLILPYDLDDSFRISCD